MRTLTDHVICACGKRGYRSPHAARSANRGNGHTIRVYRCEHGSLHVTKRRAGLLPGAAPRGGWR